jgi:hypothetical protein
MYKHPSLTVEFNNIDTLTDEFGFKFLSKIPDFQSEIHSKAVTPTFPGWNLLMASTKFSSFVSPVPRFCRTNVKIFIFIT